MNDFSIIQNKSETHKTTEFTVVDRDACECPYKAPTMVPLLYPGRENGFRELIFRIEMDINHTFPLPSMFILIASKDDLKNPNLSTISPYLEKYLTVRTNYFNAPNNYDAFVYVTDIKAYLASGPRLCKKLTYIAGEDDALPLYGAGPDPR